MSALEYRRDASFYARLFRDDDLAFAMDTKNIAQSSVPEGCVRRRPHLGVADYGAITMASKEEARWKAVSDVDLGISGRGGQFTEITMASLKRRRSELLRPCPTSTSSPRRNYGDNLWLP